ncbi:MAG: A24 family peptidase [Telluria sp.]
MTITLLSDLTLATLLLGCALRDLFERRIPNPYLAAGFACAALLQLAAHGLPGLLDGLGGALVGLGLLLPLYLVRGMGAGDVKLMAAAGAFLGPALALRACLASVFAGGAAALVLFMIYRDSKARFAYGPAIAAGTLAVLIWTR